MTPDQKWQINEAFIDQQLAAGKQFMCSHDPAKAVGFFLDEVEYLEGVGYHFVRDGIYWKAVK